MDFGLTEEQQAIRDLAAQILTDHSEPGRLRALETSGEPRFDRELWSTLAEAGVLGACLPTEHGGAGLGLVELGLIAEQAGRTAAAVPLWETLSLGADVLATHGPEGLASTWLPRVGAGEAVLTAAWHEPLDASVGRTVATVSGDEVRISGTKIVVPAGAIADALVVPAFSDSGGPVLALVEVGSGVEVVAEQTTAGTPDATVVFDRAPGALIAQGDQVLAAAFERAVATQCAVMMGLAESALRITAQYTKDRKQFDTPIATFQAVAHRAADAFVDTEGIRLTTMQALWRLANGLPATAEVSIAKFWAAEAGQRVVHAAQHLHGGMGVDRDYPVHRFFLLAKQYELQLGGASASLGQLGALIAAGQA